MWSFSTKKGHELYAAPNTDLRAIMEGFAIDGEWGDEVYRITGHKPSLLFTPARLKWFQANYPRIYEKIATALSIGDWITYRAIRRAGSPRLSRCVADLGLVDIHEVKWSDTLGERLRLSRGVCPMIVASGTRVGWIRLKLSKRRDLSTGTMVVAGGADTLSAACWGWESKIKARSES